MPTLAKCTRAVVGIGLLAFLTGCATNPLIKPFDVFMNETGVPYMEKKLLEDLESKKIDNSFFAAKKLEIDALRALLREAKNESQD